MPGDFATIQACIDYARSRVDECLVAPGTYHETINFLGKAITLRSSGGADVTIIDASGLYGSVVSCINGEGQDTVLEGFTITGGTGTIGAYGYTYGGGMYNRNSSPAVINCTFSGNTALHSGGGMYNANSSPTVTNCNFSGNTASNVGGGMYNGYSSLTVANCTFSGNTAAYGGGIFNYSSGPRLTNCTFAANAAAYGGGLYNDYDSIPWAINCILWGDSPDEIKNNNNRASIIRFSDVQGGLPFGAINGGGNLNLDPMFEREPDPGPDGEWDGVDDDYGDLRLRAGSPGIDAGDPGFVTQPAETDLDGHARVLCGRVDMGAYEFGIGDYDCNQTFDLTDFAAWNACMTGPLDSDAFHSTIDIRQSTFSCETFDFDSDADVDFLDFAAWLNAFTAE